MKIEKGFYYRLKTKRCRLSDSLYYKENTILSFNNIKVMVSKIHDRKNIYIAEYNDYIVRVFKSEDTDSFWVPASWLRQCTPIVWNKPNEEK